MKRVLTPIQIIALGFLLFSLMGAVVLSLPVASASGAWTPFLDALFTATSAVTTTGLIVVDTGSYFNLFGQIVIMLLFQVGGLGYMLFFVFFSLLLGKRLSLHESLLLKESVKRPFNFDAKQFTLLVLGFTFLVEAAGALALYVRIRKTAPAGHAWFSGIFHSVSAFNTAGFSIYPDSVTRYGGSMAAVTVITLVFLAGSLGFWVVFDTFRYGYFLGKGRKPNRLSAHSKLVYLLTFVFGVLGTGILFFAETGNGGEAFKTRALDAFFQAMSASSTTGFNTVDIGGMRTVSLAVIIGFMFIGAGSGSTAGGIKISTFGVLVASVYSTLRGREGVNLFRRNVREDVVKNAFAIFTLAMFWLFMSTAALTATEDARFLDVLFENASALGTVGLSTGITGDLSTAGKWIVVVSMLIGRVGPLGIGLSVFTRHRQNIEYPEGDVFIG